MQLPDHVHPFRTPKKVRIEQDRIPHCSGDDKDVKLKRGAHD
jgi:hypothetical protein